MGVKEHCDRRLLVKVCLPVTRGFGSLGLDRRVFDPMLVAEHGLNRCASAVAVRARSQDDMDGAANLVVAGRPNMKIVQAGDVRQARDFRPYIAECQPGRDAFEQHVRRVAQQNPSARQDP